jgi:hypothetical protein
MSNLPPPNDHPPPYISNEFFGQAGRIPSPSAPTFSDLSISGQQNKGSEHASEYHEYPGGIHAQGFTYPQGYAPISQQYPDPPPPSHGYSQPATEDLGYDQGLSQPRQVIVQPGSQLHAYSNNGTLGDQPREHYDWTMFTSIVVCICCFWPLGLAAIIFASKARNSTDTTQAKAAARTSRILSIISAVVGVIIIALLIAYLTGSF